MTTLTFSVGPQPRIFRIVRHIGRSVLSAISINISDALIIIIVRNVPAASQHRCNQYILNKSDNNNNNNNNNNERRWQLECTATWSACLAMITRPIRHQSTNSTIPQPLRT